LIVGTTVWDEVYLVETPPKWGEKTIRGQLPKELPGGMAARTAWCLGHWDERPLLLSVVGSDREGNAIANWLKKARVDVAHFEQHDGKTSRSFIVVSGGGERTPFMSMSPLLTNQGLPRPLISQICSTTKIAFFDGAGNTELQRRLIQELAESEAEVIIDIETAESSIADAIRFTSIAIFAEQYFVKLFGDERIKQARIKQALTQLDVPGRCRLVGCTLGARGSVWLDKQSKEVIAVGAYEDTNVRDTTGCGDAFKAGLIYGLAHSYSLEDCLKYATATASYVAETIGFPDVPPSLSEVASRAELVSLS